MEKGPNIVKLHFNPQASGSARHQVDVHLVNLGPRGEPGATLTIHNATKCSVRVCFKGELFSELECEPDTGGGLYFYKDLVAHEIIELATTKQTAPTTLGSGGDPYEFRFRGAGCNFPSVGDLHRSLRSKGIDPGDDPRVVIGG